jgi:long-chain acyl-CoA synthetase
MIISGGYKIYPRHLEEELYKHPAIAEAAVIGVPHPERVQQPKVFVVKKEGMELTASEVKDYLRDKVAGYYMPQLVEFRDSLPKSIIGKILKKDLVAEEKIKAAKGDT